MIPRTFRTKNYIIMPYRRNDLDRFLEMVLSDEVVSFMGGATGIREDEERTFSRIFGIYEDAGTGRIFEIMGIYSQGKLVGHLEIKQSLHTTDDELEIVYMTHPDERRKGIMKEVLEFIRLNRDIWGKRFIATVDHENTVSLGLLEKWGIEKKEVIHDEKGSYLKLHLLR